MHAYEVRPRKDHHGVDLIFDVLPEISCSLSASLASAMFFLVRRSHMKALRSLTTVVSIVACICGCATTGTEGVVQIGPISR
jgi:hypothetical protein